MIIQSEIQSVKNYYNYQKPLMSKDYDYIFKIILIGNSSVGKSSLIRFADNVYQSPLPTIGADFKIRTIKSEGTIMKLQIWDTAGQERFKTITASYYKRAHGIILVYDITNRQSFKDIDLWLDQVDRYGNQNMVLLLVGNKSDLQVTSRQVKYEEGKAFADSIGITFMETSAKDAESTEKALLTLSNQIKSRLQSHYKLPTKPFGGLPPKKDKNSCC